MARVFRRESAAKLPRKSRRRREKTFAELSPQKRPALVVDLRLLTNMNVFKSSTIAGVFSRVYTLITMEKNTNESLRVLTVFSVPLGLFQIISPRKV